MTNDLDRRFLLGGLAGAAGISALAAMAKGAGPLNPPAGAVASTAKPLADLEPRTAINAANTPGDATAAFIISQPGSYYLTANTPVPPGGQDTIRITANGGTVIIDLNGFTIASANNAVRIAAAATSDVTVQNGVIVNCNNAVTSAAVVALNARLLVSNVRFSNCLACISTQSPVEVRNCSLNNSSGLGTPVGINGGARSLVESCLVATPGSNNIMLGAQSIVRNCIVNGSSGYSVDVGGGSFVDSCTLSNGNTGIRIGQVSGGPGGAVRNCTLSAFAIAGINAVGSTIEGNTIITPQTGTPRGIESQGNCDIVGNRIDGSAGAGVGIRLYSGRNTVRANGVSGFSGTNGIGISIFPTAGTGNAGNKIVDNELVSNWLHIGANAFYNFIARNTMSFVGAGGNFNNAGNNAYGPFVLCNNTDLSTVAGTTHPHANLVY
ncbi:MAG: hypothetical protein QM783_13285 [Phycisphaerales bacterium]